MITRITVAASIILAIVSAGLWVENGRLRNVLEEASLANVAQRNEAVRLADSLKVVGQQIELYHGWYQAIETEYDSLRAEYLRANLITNARPPRPRPTTAAELRASMLRSVGR